jgi:hypothetical protein
MKRDNLLIIVSPILLFLFMIVSREVIVQLYQAQRIDENSLQPLETATFFVLAFLGGLFPLLHRENLRLSVNKPLLILTAILTAIHVIATIVLVSSGREVTHSNDVYAMLIFLFSASFALGSQKKMHTAHIVCIAISFLAVWGQFVLLGSLYALQFNQDHRQPPYLLFVVSESLALLILGATICHVSSQNRAVRLAIPASIIAGILASVAAIYLAFVVASTVGFTGRFADTPFGDALTILRLPSARYMGFTHLAYYLGGWYATLLFVSHRTRAKTALSPTP